MAKSSPKLEWCVVRLGQDMNWWVEETSDLVNWDTVDGLSILDPRQVNYVLDGMHQLEAYGLHRDAINGAFIRFRIEKELPGGRIRLIRTNTAITGTEEPVFALPDIVDEEKGPYADLIHQLTKARVKMLNDVIDFEEHLTVDELEDEIRESQNEDYMEGVAVHVFQELTSILDYVPEGYEIDVEEKEEIGKDEEKLGDEFPDLEEEEDFDGDETMKWSDDDEEEEEEDEYLVDEDEEEEEKPRRRASKPETKATKPQKRKANKPMNKSSKKAPAADKKKAPAKKK